jgi:hypothetical protein
VIAAASGEAEARDPGHLRARVVLVDGAEHQLSLIRAEAARRGVAVHIVIGIRDFEEYCRFHLEREHSGSTPALTSDNTRSAPDRPAHFRRAAPISDRRQVVIPAMMISQTRCGCRSA